MPQHTHKRGTPTMGGIAVILSTLAGYVVSHIRAGVVYSDQGLVMWIAVFVMAGIGLVDDLKKVRSGHNRGVLWKVKGYITVVVAIALAALLVVVTDVDTHLR